MARVQTINLEAIARRAGVSKATVSRALRADANPDAITGQRVREAASRLGYQPNPMVTALMTQIRSATRRDFRGGIALLNPWPERHLWQTNGSLSLFMAGVQARAKQLGFTLDEIWLHETGRTPERTGKALRARGHVGVLVFPFPFDDASHSLEIDLADLAVATMGYSLRTPDVHRACANHYASVAMALTQLQRRGYRRIGFVATSRLVYRSHGMLSAAYLTWQHTEARRARLPALLLGHDNADQGRRQFVAWYREHRPDAILGYYRPVLSWLSELGARVPDDIGYADLGLTPLNVAAGTVTPGLYDPAVSGVDLQWRDVGAAAVDLIVDQINRNEHGVPRAPRVTLVPGLWHEGKTLRPPP